MSYPSDLHGGVRFALHQPRVRPPKTRQDARRELLRIKEQAQGTGSGRLRVAIFGINDGLVTNASLIIGVTAAAPDRKVVILAGIAGLVAGGFSMAVEFIGMSVQREMFELQIALECRELEENPEAERHELAVIYRARGCQPKTLSASPITSCLSPTWVSI